MLNLTQSQASAGLVSVDRGVDRCALDVRAELLLRRGLHQPCSARGQVTLDPSEVENTEICKDAEGNTYSAQYCTVDMGEVALNSQENLRTIQPAQRRHAQPRDLRGEAAE